MLRSTNLTSTLRRLKSSQSRAGKSSHTARALASFDDFYNSVFGIRWRNIRVAMLTQHKYIAVVNNFGDTEKTCALLESNGAICIKNLVKLNENKGVSSIDKPHSNYNLDLKLQRIIRDHDEQHTMYDSLKRDDEPQKTLHPTSNMETLEYELSRIVDPKQSSGGLYEFMPANKIKGMENWVSESTYYKYYETNADFPLEIELETEFEYPQNLELYTYEIGNFSDFERPQKCSTGVLSHYLMDGASMLPALLLDIRQGETVLDACAAPGGKSLLMLQNFYPKTLVCNDIQESRVNRIRKVMEQYVFNFKKDWQDKCVVLNQCDARNIDKYGRFDKILVDVPCSNDRHSLMENENNIFKPTRIKERLRLPELQAGILANCLRLLRVGGSLIYSTCTLSPVQNDGVVHMALKKVFNENNITTKVKDLRLIPQLFSDILRFENPSNLKYGQLVLPYLPANFGPMYFSKIVRKA